MDIPRSTDYTLRRGDQSVAVWALQRVMNKLGIPTSEDGDFGKQTEANAKALQIKLRVASDGVVGGGTQQALAHYLCDRQERADDLPENLLLSSILYESGGYLGAVNWSVAGGVDCGMTQRRVYDSSKTDATIKRAFDASYQVGLSGSSARELHDIFLARPGVFTHEGAYRVATLNHNYPSLADRISRVGIKSLSAYYTSPQTWVVVNDLHFPDGAPIRTPLEWGQRYALGNKEHNEPGQAVKLVTSWS